MKILLLTDFIGGIMMSDSFLHFHQSALDSQREDDAIRDLEDSGIYPDPDNDVIFERLYEEEVEESLNRLEKLGFKDITESDLDSKSIEEAVMKKFEDLAL
tara:strand:- start:486 stop:788 length:303 start_codon:yes stop_codon:yes gene_type:complete